MSLQALISLFIYAFTSVLCAAAALSAKRRGTPRAQHYMFAFSTAVIALALLCRGMGLEDTARAALREMLRASGRYAERSDIQTLLAALVILTAVALLFGMMRWWPARSPGRGELFARLAATCSAGYLLLLMTRVISLHSLDSILYSGPIRLNWVLDLGLCAIVAGCAVLYIRRRPAQRRPSARL